MKKNLISAVLVAVSMSLSAPAAAGLFDWMMGKAVENAVEGAVIDALMGKTKATATKNGKAKAQPVPVASTVKEGDHFRLPLTGAYRFPVPKGVDIKDLEVGPAGGYLDRFGSEWVPYRANGRLVAWRSNLSERGLFRMGRLADGRDFVLVGVDGKKVALKS